MFSNGTITDHSASGFVYGFNITWLLSESNCLFSTYQGLVYKLNSGINIFLQYKPEEIAAIVNDFEEPGTLAPTGLYLGGAKYMVIQGEPGVVIRGKKVLS